MNDQARYPEAAVAAFRCGACDHRWHGYWLFCPETERCPTCGALHVQLESVEAYDGPGAPTPAPAERYVSPLFVRRTLDI